VIASTTLLGALLASGCRSGSDLHPTPSATSTGGMVAAGSSSTMGNSLATAGASGSKSGVDTGGNVAPATAGSTSATAGKSGARALGGSGGAPATGGAGGSSGFSGAIVSGGVGGAPPTAGTSSTGNTMGHGRACHSMEEWTPKLDDIWIAPTGSDSDAGTEGQPKKTLTAAVAAWSSGKTVWVKPGSYAYSAAVSLATKATAAGPLRISGVTGAEKPVFDFSSEPRASNNDGVRGLQISGSYLHLHYLEIKKAADNCVYVTGSNNTLEWLSVHECQDTGVQVSSGAASNRILNVDSYLNADPSGENADGFAPKLSIGKDNYFCGTRSYQNADDGYDCWSAGDSSPVTFEYCWALGQPGPTATANGDGNGFKLGSPASLASGGNAPHKLIECFAFDNRNAGFTSNGNSSGKVTCTNCGVWGNGTAWSPGTGGAVPKHTGDITNLSVSADKAKNAPRDASGDLPDIKTL
jgi:hypothetical protein